MRPQRSVDLLLKLEWLAVFASTVLAYAFFNGSWKLFVLLVLAPDLSMLGYLAGPRHGAIAYNACHMLVWRRCCRRSGSMPGTALPVQLAVIWIAHIAFDRALGYGLKLPTGFHDTHLGRIGRN